MKIAILGTNGLLSNSFANYCILNSLDLVLFGLNKPADINAEFIEINIIEGLDVNSIIGFDVIVYAIGAGIQSNLNEDAEIIYQLNSTIPIDFILKLHKANYQGYFVTFGSYFEIGENNSNKKFDENELICSQLKAPNDYSISKRLLTRFMSSFNGSVKNLHFILPTIYGENEASHRLIPYVIQSIKNKEEVNFTSGNQIRQYIYIDDIPKMIFQAILKDVNSGVYNIAGTETLSVKEVVSMIYSQFNLSVPKTAFGTIERVDAKMGNLQLDGNKLLKMIDYKPIVKIEDIYEKYK